MMVAFIDQYRDVHGVEPICKELPIAPSVFVSKDVASIDHAALDS